MQTAQQSTYAVHETALIHHDDTNKPKGSNKSFGQKVIGSILKEL